ncbi:MAG: SDR family oxidoreductase [Solirubrobacterales bacterium]|nr:SDR family oxidoreductase [Solirubrobacterales bacterium]
MFLTLVTGFPGFIGRRLVRELLDAGADARVVAVVEPRMLDAAAEVAAEIGGDRIELLGGDIRERGLGLESAQLTRLRAETTKVFHLAAIYNLAVPKELAQAVNVEGTGNVLEVCEGMEKLERLAYISTAYVAGKRTGIVYEHELSLGQDFKNHYESTKFQAEVWVRQRMGRVPTTILRPAIVVGDSRTGETEKFDGPYYILRTISRMDSMGMSAAQFGRSDASFNVVPVDYVVKAIAAAAGAESTLGETLHLVDPDPLSSLELFKLLSQLYAGRELRGRVPAGLVSNALRIGKVRDAFSGTPPEAVEYLNHPVTYDTRRAVDLLGPLGLAPPPFPEYAETIVDFFRAHEDDPKYAPPSTDL